MKFSTASFTVATTSSALLSMVYGETDINQLPKHIKFWDKCNDIHHSYIDAITLKTLTLNHQCVTTMQVKEGQTCDCRVTELEADSFTCAEDCVYDIPEVGEACPNLEDYTGANWIIDNHECGATDDAPCVVKNVSVVPLPESGKPHPTTIYCHTRHDEYTASPSPSQTQVHCDEYAYDNKNYCKCATPTPIDSGYEVSVCGDATYKVTEKPCSGPISEKAAGEACPKAGDVAVNHCRNTLLSYLKTGSEESCVAPEDATCEKLGSGAWGCVFPGNCNTVNTCFEEPKCEGDYQKSENGTCIIAKNGYPVPTHNNTCKVNVTKKPYLQEGQNLKTNDGNNGGTAIVISSILVLSTIIGASILV